MTAELVVTRSQILEFRRRVGSLGERMSHGPESLRQAAWAGIQDSMPRAAVLSIHARVHDVEPAVLDDDSLVQIWGPRYSAYVVAEHDRAVFTLGRLPDDPAKRQRAHEIADRIEALLGSDERHYSDVGKALGVNHNHLRYGAPTGRLLLGWAGSGKPTIRMAEAPTVDPAGARAELARRHLHIFGPTTARAFAQWAGLRDVEAESAHEHLRSELVSVRTPIGDASILAADEAALVASNCSTVESAVRLLPSGDTWYLLQGRERELVVPSSERRDQLWPSRVWPGAVLVGCEVAGTWRRSAHEVTIDSWRHIGPSIREAIEAEAATLPLALGRPVTVTW